MNGPVRFTALVLIVATALCRATGQESQRESELTTGTPDSLRPRNSASILFDRNLNTFTWSGLLRLDTSAARTRISVGAQLLANIVQPEGGSGRASESTQGNLRLSVSHPLTDFAALTTRWSSLTFADNRGIGLSNAFNHIVLAGVSFLPSQDLTLTPLGGYRWDGQGGLHDEGMALGLDADLRPLDLDGYLFSGLATLRRDAVTPRILENHNAQLGVYKPFGDFSRDSLDLRFTQTRREFYSRGDSAIESRTDRIFSLANLLSYEIARSLVSSIFVSISTRLLDKDERTLFDAARSPTTFDTQIEEFHLDTYVQVAYETDDRFTSTLLRLGYSERSEAHRAKTPEVMAPNIAVLFGERNRQEQTKDNYARRVGLTGALMHRLFSATDLMLAGSAGILRYDTPSDLNYEDRDELLVALSIGLHHVFSPVLEAQFTLDGTLSHLVYLLKERSANNNHNRVLRLAPQTIWRPTPWLVTRNTFEVLANYTVYDFEKQLALVQSFSYRQFSWIDTTRVEFTSRIGLDFFTYLKLYERGSLKWEEFREKTENAYVDRTLAIQMRFSPEEAAVFAVGIRYFSQSRYVFVEGVRTPDAYTSSIGPTCAVRWMIGPHSRLRFEGWYERRKQPDGLFRSLATFAAHIYFQI